METTNYLMMAIRAKYDNYQQLFPVGKAGLFLW